MVLKLAMVLGSFGDAQAACGNLNATLSNINIAWSESYASQTETFTITRTGHGSCNYVVTFTKGGATSYAGRRMTQGSFELPYQLHKKSSLSSSSILKDFPAATTISNVITGSFSGGGASQSKPYYVAISSSGATTPTLARAGVYTDTLVVKAYEGTFSSHLSVPDDTNSVQISTVVPQIIRISLVATGAPFDSGDTAETLSFGNLVQGDSRSFDLKVVTNSGYSISFSSQNNGVLRHPDTSVLTTIPYAVQVGGMTQSLGSSQTVPVVVASASGSTSLSGANKDVSVTIGSVADKVAGNYSDVITVTATTLE